MATSRPRRTSHLARALAFSLVAALTYGPELWAADAAVSQESAGVDAPNPAPTAEPAAAELHYRVIVDAPSELAATLTRVVGLARWQDFADMTDELLDRLAVEAIDEAREAAATEGFFSASIDVSIDRQRDPIVVTLKVIPGEPTRIASVRIEVTGPAANDAPRGTDAIAAVRSGWSLGKGEVFRQSAWTAAKNGALATLTASPYAAARIAHSEAHIDPATQSGALDVELDSGPEFRFGDMEIVGLQRYPPSLVQNFSTIRPGDPHSRVALQEFARRLNASGYFSSAQVSIDPETTHPDDATIYVGVLEGPSRSLEGGFGYSTDVLFRANATYRDVNFNGRGLQFLAEGRLESKEQSASLRFTLPPNGAGWIGTFGGAVARTDIEGLVTRTAAVGTRWHTVEPRRERAVSATFYVDEQQPSGAETIESHALYLEGEQYWRNLDDLLAPNRGWMASVQLGGGPPGVSTRGFGRVIGRFAAWYPIDRATTLTTRAIAGAVLSPTRTGIPSTLLFRTGGDTTVRGYAYESLGVQEGDAVVGGRYLAVASAEAIRWISEAWGLATFVDAGNAGDSLPDFRFDLGYGVGARVRTPIGPFRVDVAYGQQSHDVRLHLSVGLSF